MSSDGDLARRIAEVADDAAGRFVAGLTVEETRGACGDLWDRKMQAVATAIRAELAPLLAERDALRLIARMDSAVTIDDDLDGTYWINMNDVFAFALADGEELLATDLPTAYEIWSEHGRDGLEAWVCLRRDEREPRGAPWLPFVYQGKTEYPARIEAMKVAVREMLASRAARGAAP